jgi:hypothetical protein
MWWDPPPLSNPKIIFPINYLGGGGLPHFGYPAQQGKADVNPELASERRGCHCVGRGSFNACRIGRSLG